jgi:hypothetical protein
MLHVDDNTLGTYEFGQVEGADGPVRDSAGNVLTFPINAAPSLVMNAQDPLPGEADGTLRFRVAEALIDLPGWLAIHTNNAGQPGPVIGTALLHTGSNKNLLLEVDAAQAGTQVFPMLHYDTGEVGTYEFGAVEGADTPTFVGGAVVVAPLALSAAASTEAPTEAPADQTASACAVTGNGTVNRRSGPSTAFSVSGQLGGTQTANVTAQTTGADGFVWFQTDDGTFVRSDVVTTSGDCSGVPTITVDTAAPAVPAPNATQEASS